jgi:hypothetical protein
MPFGLGRKNKKRVIVRTYKALTEGGMRKEFEKDANKFAEKGYRPTSTADHPRAGWAGTQMMVTYELVQDEK